jgi:hypothetical protein
MVASGEGTPDERRGDRKAVRINSYACTLDHTAAACLSNFAARGYREFEVMVYPCRMWPKAMPVADRAALHRHAESLGARIVMLNMVSRCREWGRREWGIVGWVERSETQP